MVDEKLDFFFLCVLIKDCISKVLCMIWELLASYLDLLRCCLSAAEPARFYFLWAMQQLCVDFNKDSLLYLLSLLRSSFKGPFLFLQLCGYRRVLVRSGPIFIVFYLLLLLRVSASFLEVGWGWARGGSGLMVNLTCYSLPMRCRRSIPFLVSDIKFINVQLLLLQNYSQQLIHQPQT